MELLLSDSSRAHLDQTAIHPIAGAPSCPVESPFSCVAVRRGHPVVFETSEALNACPKLRDREQGPCSAVCVPISFMGRSLGVLHATGPDGVSPEQGTGRAVDDARDAGRRAHRHRRARSRRRSCRRRRTGSPGSINRRTLETDLRGLLRQDRPFALALADLDHFKRLNDTHGHEEGDRSLRLFSHVVRQVLRDDDLVARWGGEEFLIALPDADADAAVEVMDRIRAHLARTLDGGQVRFTASFGVTDSTAAPSLQELIQLADIGLYLSKAAGRDRISIGVWGDVARGARLRATAPSARRRCTARPQRTSQHPGVASRRPRRGPFPVPMTTLEALPEMVPTWLILSATVALLVLWLALAAWVVGARVSHDRLVRSRRRDARLLADGGDPTRWSRRRLWRTADGDAAGRRRGRRPRARLARTGHGCGARPTVTATTGRTRSAC